MGVPWHIELNPDVTVMTDGTSCVIGGVVSLSFELHEVEFVWSEEPDLSIDPTGLLKLCLRNRPGTLAAIRLRRGEAERMRTMLETGGSRPH